MKEAATHLNKYLEKKLLAEDDPRIKKFCIKGCEFLKYGRTYTDTDVYAGWRCSYYETMLDQDLSISGSSMRPCRCKECLSEDEEVDKREKIAEIKESLMKIKNFVTVIEEQLEEL